MEKQLSLNLSFGEKFCKYHEENPQIYSAFKEYALRAVRFKQHFGSKAIFEVIRWNSAVSGNDGFKVNNNYTSFYARLFELEYPRYEGFFIKRKSKFD